MEKQVEIIKRVNNQEAMDSRDVAKMIGKRHQRSKFYLFHQR